MSSETTPAKSLNWDLDPSYIKDNILSLRRRLKLSQSEFIKRYLSDENKKPLISVSKLSNFERQGIGDPDGFARLLATAMSIESDVFLIEPELFAKNIDLLIESDLQNNRTNLSSIGELVRRENYVKTLVRVISDYLSDSILAGDMRPGDKLPSDRNLSTMFGVGRTSIREALKVLNVLGMIDILPGQGTFIAAESSDFFITPLSWAFFMGERNVNHIIDVRNVLEIQSAKLATQHAEPKDLENLLYIFERSSKAYLDGNLQDFLDLDLDFHLAIAKCSRNPIIQSLLLTARNLIRYISKSGMVNLTQLKNIFEEHNQIYNAVISNDPIEASHKMALHLEKSKERYLVTK